MLTGFRTEPVQDIDAMYEADTAAEWERLNEEPEDAEKYRDAASEMEDACEKLGDAMNYMSDAAHEADGTVGYDRVVSLMNDLEDIYCEILILKNHMKEGRCE